MQGKVQLLAGPKVRLEKGWVAHAVTRPLLLLCYLAYRETWVSREELLTLFWPEVREARARQSLRSLLYSLKKAPYGGMLELESSRVRCLADTDVRAFRDRISRGEWPAAVDAYQGTFMELVLADDSANFEAWLEATRDELHRAWRDAALQVAADYSGRGEHAQAARLLHTVMRYDVLDEEVVVASMRAQSLAGQKRGALAAFEAFSRSLERELELKPLPDTVALATAIRRDDVSPSDRQLAHSRDTAAVPFSSPQPITPFVGRTLELLELADLLADPRNRLITLLGVGGMGKTRLSLRLLEEQAQRFEDGGIFIPLAALQSAVDVPNAAAQALQLDLSGQGSVERAVVEHLADKHELVVLDNFEHVLAAAPFVEQLLQRAPRCTFICTSRVLLGIGNETVYDLSGLTVPASPNDDDLEAYDAAELFVRSARRVRSDFNLRKRDAATLFELCRLLDGMPLALELAASWVRLFNLEDLVKELRRDVDLLATTGRQVSERHRSLRKVFEQSWQLLDHDSQGVLAGLSVFQGSFDREAARGVTDASATALLSLVNTSLVRGTASGRFLVLLVLRQYAAEKLAEGSGSVLERHGTYYLNLLASTSDTLEGPMPKPVLTRLELDLENIRAGWYWACGARRFDLCASALRSLRVFFTARARLQEGAALLEHALEALEAGPANAADDRSENWPNNGSANGSLNGSLNRRVNGSDSMFLAQVLIELAYFSRRLDRQDQAHIHAVKALHVTQTLGGADVLEIGSRCELAIIDCWTGDLSHSARHAEQALALAEALADTELIMRCRSRLALAKRYLGAFEEALTLYQAVLAYERGRRRQIAMLRTLSDLGRLYVDMNEPVQAATLFREGLELAKRHAIAYELGFMWEGLAQCSLLLGDHALARQQAETALRCSEAVNDSMGVAVQCAELAKIHVAMGLFEAAETFLRRALAIAWDKQEIPEVMRLLTTWATLMVREQAWGRAAPLLVRISEHPGAQAVHKREARELLGRIDADAAEYPSGTLAGAVNELLLEA